MPSGGVSGLASAIEGETPGVTPRAGSNGGGGGVSALASRFEQADAAPSGPMAKVSAIASKFAPPVSPGMRRVPSGKGGAPFKSTPAKRPSETVPPAVAGLASRFEQVSVAPVMPRTPSAKSAPAHASSASSASDDKASAPRVSAVAERFSGGGGGAGGNKGGANAFAAAQGAFLKAESDARAAEPASRVKAAASVFGDTVTTATGVSPLKRIDSKVKSDDKGERVSEKVVQERARSVSKVASVFEKNEPQKKEGEEDAGPSLKERFEGAAKVFGGTV